MVKKFFNYRANESKRTRSICREKPIMRFVKALLFDWRKKRAIKKAKNDAALYGKKFLVLVFNGKPVVVSMQGIKRMIRRGRFSKEFTPAKACECAIYTAYPPTKKTE